MADGIRDPLLISLRAAGLATLAAILLGGAVAHALARKRIPGKPLVQGISILPMVLPPTVLGYYLLTAAGVDSLPGQWFRRITSADLVFSFPGIVLAATVASVPFFIWQAQAAFSDVDRELEDSARTAGATEWQVFRLITVPSARRGLIAAGALTFARALGDFGATLMVGGSLPGQTRTLPLAVYDAWQIGDTRLTGALALILVGVGLVVAVAAAHLTQRESGG